MKHSVLLERLQNLTGKKIRITDISKTLAINYSAIANRAKRDSDYSFDELEKISQAYNVDIINNHLTNTHGDKVEIQYYINPNLQTNIKTPKVTSIWFDRELVENIWNMNPSDLRIVTMLGDKMDFGSYPLRKNDILIMDISDKDVTKAGIYAFTTHNDTYMFINGINRRFDGTYRFYFYNNNYPEKILTDEEVEKADIKVVGRIVKNLSLTI